MHPCTYTQEKGGRVLRPPFAYGTFCPACPAPRFYAGRWIKRETRRTRQASPGRANFAYTAGSASGMTEHTAVRIFLRSHDKRICPTSGGLRGPARPVESCAPAEGQRRFTDGFDFPAPGRPDSGIPGALPGSAGTADCGVRSARTPLNGRPLPLRRPGRAGAGGRSGPVSVVRRLLPERIVNTGRDAPAAAGTLSVNRRGIKAVAVFLK